MRKNRDKELLLEQLKKVPILSVACEKVGIARSTVYRWKEQNKKFAKAMEEAMVEGEALINDMSEAGLISLIKERNFPSIRFWLNHRHAKFREKIDINANIQTVPEELTPEQEALMREALRMASSELESINEEENEKGTT